MKANPLLYFGISLFMFLFANPEIGLGQDYKVGDHVKFEYRRDEVTGVIKEIKASGRMYVITADQGFDVGRLSRDKTVLQSKIIGRVKSGSSGSGNPSGEAKMRTWRSGKYEIEASFVDLVDGKVKLLKKDGLAVDVGLEVLHPEDAALAMKLKSGTAGANPFAGGETSGNPESAMPEFTVKEFNFKSTKIINAELAKTGKFTSKVAPATRIDNTQSHQLPIGANNIIVDSRNPTRVWVGDYSLKEKTETGFVINLETGQRFGPFKYPKKSCKTVAFDSQTNRLVTADKLGSRRKDSLVDLWRVAGTELEHVVGFNPSSGRSILVNSGFFVDGTHLMLIARGVAGLYNLETQKAETAITFSNVGSVKSDPTNQLLMGGVGAHADKTAIFDHQNKKLVTTVDQKSGLGSSFAVNRDLTKVVTADLSTRRVVVTELATGKMLAEVYVQFSVIAGKEAMFLDDENILFTGKYGSALVNTRLKSPIWNYKRADFIQLPGQTDLLAVASGMRDTSVQLMALPHPSAKQFIEKTTLEDLIVIPNGASISLSGSGLSSAAAQNITKQLGDRGFSVAGDAPFYVKATSKKGAATTRTYQDLTGGADETVTIQSESYEFAIYDQNDEKVWWRTGGSSNDPGSFVQLNEGESVQSRANSRKGSAEGFFNNIRIPDVFVKIPPDGGFYGQTSLKN